MMESQGQPCLKGFPETQTGATHQHDKDETDSDCEITENKGTADQDITNNSLPPKKRHKGNGSQDVFNPYPKKRKTTEKDEENIDDIDDASAYQEQKDRLCDKEASESDRLTNNDDDGPGMGRGIPYPFKIKPRQDKEDTSISRGVEHDMNESVAQQNINEQENVTEFVDNHVITDSSLDCCMFDKAPMSVNVDLKVGRQNVSLTTLQGDKSKGFQECVEESSSSVDKLPNSEENASRHVSPMGETILKGEDAFEVTQEDNNSKAGDPLHSNDLNDGISPHEVANSQQLETDHSCLVVSSPVHVEPTASFPSHSHESDGVNTSIHYDKQESHTSGDFTHQDEHDVEGEQDGKPVTLKLDLEQLQLLNVGGSVEYMETLPATLVAHGHDGSITHGDQDTSAPQDEDGNDDNVSSAHEAVVFHSDQITKTSRTEGISIQVYPQSQGISLVTPSGIQIADMSAFPGQVPTILTEGDADEHDMSATYAEQFQVVTTSSVLAGHASGTDTLSVMMPSGEFGRSVVLTDQQRVLISGMLMPGMVPGQTVHISLPQPSASAGDTSQSQDEGCHEEEQNLETDDDKDGQPHVCPIAECKKVCPRAHKLKLHMLSHTGERPYKCPHEGCGWAFTTGYKLKRHERGHTGERPFMCPQEGCGRRFTTAYNLKTHIRAHGRTNSIMCHYEGCDKAFPTMHKFRIHERKHQMEENPYRCEVDGCGKVFSAMGTLTSHLKSHSGERPHGCPMEGCEKRFTKASKLKLHLRSHTGERPFCCDEESCGWSFTSAYKLKRHMRKHTGERPFVCSYEGCHKSFTRSSHLKTHTLAHTGEKPYMCPVDGCNKAFTAGSSLNIHLRKHTGDKPYRCDEMSCNKAYTTAANLRAHQKRHDKTNTSCKQTEDSGLVAGTGDELLHTEYATVSSAGSLVDSDIHTFPPEEFTTSEAISLPVISSHFQSSVIVSSTMTGSHDLTHGVKTVPHILPDHRPKRNSDKSTVMPVSNHFGQTSEHAVHLGNAVDGSQIDVAEFVVRSDTGEPVLHSPETSGGVTEKHAGGFDLSITSMVSHLRCHPSPDGKLLTSEGQEGGIIVDHKIPIPSRTLEFRSPVNPEDQFAPPAVIFQEDSIKSGSSDAEGEGVQQTSDLPSPTQGPAMQISLPHDVIQIHFHQSSSTPHCHSIDVETVPEGHQLQTYGSPPMAEIQDDGLNKPELSSYIDGNISSEQEDTAVDTYPESTINLQDLR